MGEKRKGGPKLTVAVPSSLGGEGESKTATSSYDFSKDSIEG